MQQKGRGYLQPTQVGHAAAQTTHQEKPDTRLAAMALHTPTVKSERLAQQRIILQWLAFLPMTGTQISVFDTAARIPSCRTISRS